MTITETYRALNGAKVTWLEVCKSGNFTQGNGYIIQKLTHNHKRHVDRSYSTVLFSTTLSVREPRMEGQQSTAVSRSFLFMTTIKQNKVFQEQIKYLF